MTTKLPPVYPRAGYLAHKDEIDAAVRRVLDAGRYILDREVAAFESDFAAYCGVAHCVGTGNGTDAIELALRSLDIGPGDLVFTVSHTAVATVAAVELAGATAALVDIDLQTYSMDPNRLEETVRAFASGTLGRPRAVLPVHLYGHPADMNAISEIAGRYDLTVIEDCAQAHGAKFHGRRVGAFGRVAIFSFYPTKNLAAFGDGGALVTDDAGLAARARALREYGWRERYISKEAGLNSRLDELQAAVLAVKLAHLDDENEARRRIAQIYEERIADRGITIPLVRPGNEHVYHQYVIRTSGRDALRAFLKDRGIGTMIHYPSPIHVQPAYRGRLPLGVGGLAVTERICKEILSLPIHPHLALEDASRVGDLVTTWASEGGRAARSGGGSPRH